MSTDRERNQLGETADTDNGSSSEQAKELADIISAQLAAARTIGDNKNLDEAYGACLEKLAQLRAIYDNGVRYPEPYDGQNLDGVPEALARALACMIETKNDDLIRLNGLRQMCLECPENVAVIRALAQAYSICEPCPTWMQIVHTAEFEIFDAFKSRCEDQILSQLRDLYVSSGRDPSVRGSLAKLLARRVKGIMGTIHPTKILRELVTEPLEEIVSLAQDAAPFTVSMRGDVEIIHDQYGVYVAAETALYCEIAAPPEEEGWGPRERFDYELSRLKASLFQLSKTP